MKHYLITIFISFCINAQIIEGAAFVPKYLPSSPNIASLGTFGMYPMNLSTGQPNINIGLFSNTGHGNDLDINLNYNISAVKPDFQTSWVGLGWNLSVGGAITRQVNGGVDEFYGTGFTDPTVLSYYDHYSRLNASNWYSDQKLTEYYSFLTPLFPSHFEANPAPDEFMFNVNGLNGSFLKNHEGKWVIKANENLDLNVQEELKYDFTFYEDGGITNQKNWFLKRIIYGFVITDQRGIKYTFGKTPNALEITGIETVDTSYNPGMFVKSWYLTQIEYPDGKNIDFEYSFDDRATYIIHSSAYYSTYKVKSTMASQSNTSGNFNYLSLDRNFYKYLSKIKFDKNEIEFHKSYSAALDYNTVNIPWQQVDTNYDIIHYRNNYNNRKHWYKLDSIVVKADNIKTDKIAFNYEENINNRLKLQNVHIGRDVQNEKTYTFKYNPMKLPAFNSNKTDHWGNYNNKNFHASVQQNPSTNTYSREQMLTYPQYREPDFTYGIAELLEKIIFPTKGYTLFQYEPHDYNKTIDRTINGFNINITGNKIAGGPRVKKMITNENGNSDSKEFFYVNDYLNGVYTSSGVSGGMPNYFDEGNINNGNLEYWKLSSSSYIPLNYTNGNYITYSKVYEKSNNGGVIEHTFSNQDNGAIDLKSNNYQLIVGNIGYINTFEPSNLSIVKNALDKLQYNNLEMERGKPLNEKYYDSNKNLLKEITYNYNSNPSRLTDKIRSINYIADVYGSPIDQAAYQLIAQMHIVSKMSAYTIFSHQTYLNSVTTTDYLNGNSIISNTQNVYQNFPHHQLISQKTTFSDLSTQESKYQYAHEKGKTDMIAANMVGIPLETTAIKKSSGLAIGKTISNSGIDYKKRTIGGKDFILPHIAYFYDLQSPSDSSTQVKYKEYDLKGNVLQYNLKTDHNGNGGFPVAIVWGYNQTKPIAKIEGATYAQVSTYITDIISKSNSDNTLGTTISEKNLIDALDLFRKTSQLSNYQITTYSYNPLIGVTSITPASGIREIYNYDTANRLQSVLDINGKILKEYSYNYAIVTYYNEAQSKTFYRNNCGTDYIGGSYTYAVPEKKYSSLISEEDANEQAINEINVNGQNSANIYGTCTHLCSIQPDPSVIEGGAIFQEVTPNHFSATVNLTFLADMTNAPIHLGNMGSCAPNSIKTFTNNSNGIVYTLTLNPNGDLMLRANARIYAGQSIGFIFDFDK
ncbi:hypothetical protein Q73A0000_06805 [Kaistella flava (ex Peng et al. 2021)]|uniref:DUF5977 domain-containing protein n=1 Tax=Kaistella flava (ex Peng et al. 2021) TaxID=2038776 RepID=A0A7M2Y8C7_9FLAO|nr:DUF5977 domain-containing protein [Kaistella flava (ex Peng et al. 2021)]QOW10089.1 hypothetical protein Q73A0000_06805 [Kaistella flava (ex Peng et al. 2021)]